MNKLRFISGLLGVSFLFLGFSNCGSSRSNDIKYQLEQDPPFTIKGVYSQDWVAGIPEGGSGTNLYISLIDFTENVVIEDIYFRKKVIKAQNSPQYRNQYIGYFKNTNRDVVMDSDPIKEAMNKPPKPFPFKLKENEAVISYLHKETIKYYKMTNIESKPKLAYPQLNPKIDK